jgi:hypothetical protein
MSALPKPLSLLSRPENLILLPPISSLLLQQHAVITKQTDNATIDLIMELDNRASLLTNPDQIASFAKNQVKLVKKFLEQQQLLKTTIRARFQNHLTK